MNRTSRRRFLAAAAMSLAATRLRAQGTAQLILTIPSEANGPHMPEDYVGLSYEAQQLVNPAFFSPKNAGLIRAFKALSAHGVLRLGGNTSEFEWWKPTSDAQEPEHPRTRVVEGEPKPQYYPVTAEAVRNLAGFLRATGWTCLYGIGMGTNTPEHAAAEAEYVAKTLGDRLQYFQIGNEVDMFDRHLRDPKTWNAKTYLDEWLAIARAVIKAVPDAKFGMPDVAANVDWLTQIAETWPSVQDPPHVTTLTHHYYFGGPATNPEVSIPNLLKPATMTRAENRRDGHRRCGQDGRARTHDRGQHAIGAASRAYRMSLHRRYGRRITRSSWRAITTPASTCTEARENPWQTRSVDRCPET